MQPSPGKRCALSERSEFARRRGWQTAQGTRRASYGQDGFGYFGRNQSISSYGDETPLLAAAHHGRFDCLKLLLDTNAEGGGGDDMALYNESVRDRLTNDG